jgi:hypothetical protein
MVLGLRLLARSSPYARQVLVELPAAGQEVLGGVAAIASQLEAAGVEEGAAGAEAAGAGGTGWGSAGA